MKFEYENVFYLLIVAAIVSIACYAYLDRKQKIISKHFAYFKELTSSVLARRRLKVALELLALVLVIFGLARPQMGTRSEMVKKAIGTDIILAIDVSNSMLTDDMKPSRLDLAKKTLVRITESLKEHRIGIIAFAGTATVISPLTNDILALKMYIDSISTTSVDTQGTNWISALKLAHDNFKQNSKDKKTAETPLVIVLISDGGINTNDKGKFDFLKKDNIVVHTIGVGGLSKVPIPNLDKGQPQGYKKDSKGEIVLTKREDGLLKDISNATDGKHYIASFDGSEIDKLSNNFKLGLGSKEDVYYSYNEWYQYFIALALFLILLEVLISDLRKKT